jgi:hypothetical protein
MLALPIDKMLCIYLLCPRSEHQKNSFQSKQSKYFHQRIRFIYCETGCNKVKVPKVGSNVIDPVPVGAGPNKVLTVVLGISKVCAVLPCRTKASFFHSFFPGKGKEKRGFLLLSTMKTFIEVAPCWLQHKL